MAVYFSNEGVNFNLRNRTILKQWICAVVGLRGKRVGEISYQFCDDSYILQVNQEYLDHDTYTDIITFDYVEGDTVSGDILISVERVADNAKQFSVTFEQEFCRVLIHGVLHLLGQKDKSPRDAKKMREREEDALMVLQSVIKASRFTWNTILYGN